MSGNLNNFQLSKNFNLSEFVCPCCKLVKLEPHLITCLQALRTTLDMPLKVTSGYRCTKHNLEIGGVENSKHIVGQAADVIADIAEPEYLLKLAIKIGFDYCYYNKDKHYYHLHIDIV